MDTSTLFIPTAMAKPMEIVGDLDPVTYPYSPVHVAGVSENPDDFCLAFYPVAQQGDVEEKENHRASIMVNAASARDEEVPILVGDILMVGPTELIAKVLKRDRDHQRDKEVVAAFREWLLSYSDMANVDPAEAFYSVASYVAHVASETMEEARRDHAMHIAEMMGLKPEQVGVFFV